MGSPKSKRSHLAWLLVSLWRRHVLRVRAEFTGESVRPLPTESGRHQKAMCKAQSSGLIIETAVSISWIIWVLLSWEMCRLHGCCSGCPSTLHCLPCLSFGKGPKIPELAQLLCHFLFLTTSYYFWLCEFYIIYFTITHTKKYILVCLWCVSMQVCVYYHVHVEGKALFRMGSLLCCSFLCTPG